MTASKKNIPKSQEEISNKRIKPTTPFNPALRGNDVSLKGDPIKDVSNSFENIVTGIMYYFKEVIKPTVVEDNTRVKVPVIYAEPERWKSAQKDGYFRDKDGQILFPVIALKIDNIEPNRTLGNKLDGNKANLYQVYQTGYTNKNQYDNFSVLHNRKPVKEFRSVVVPDYYTITFSCAVYTSFMSDMLRLIEDIGFKSNSYWGEPNKFKYNARIDGMPITQEVNQGEDRKFISRFNIILNGYIIPDSINTHLATNFSKFYSKARITLTSELYGTSESNMISTACGATKNTDIGTGGSSNVNVTKIYNVNTGVQTLKFKITATGTESLSSGDNFDGYLPAGNTVTISALNGKNLVMVAVNKQFYQDFSNESDLNKISLSGSVLNLTNMGGVYDTDWLIVMYE